MGERDRLEAWAFLPAAVLAGGGGTNAAAAFQKLDTDGKGFLSLDAVCKAWIHASNQRKISTDPAAVHRVLVARQPERFSKDDFCDVVLLWHLTGGKMPTLGRYLANSALESGVAASCGLLAAQASMLFCSLGGPPGPYLQVAAAGGFALVASSSLFHRRAEEGAPYRSRFGYFNAVSASMGVALAPIAPVLTGVLGDPQTKGYGTFAGACLAVAQGAGQAAALCAFPDGLHSSLLAGSALAAVAGGAFSAGLGVVVCRLAGRESAEQPVKLAAGVLSAYSLICGVVARVLYLRGQPEPLTAIKPHVTLAKYVLLKPAERLSKFGKQ